MFAVLTPQEFSYVPQRYYHAPSSLERYQAALRNAEEARQAYLRELIYQHEPRSLGGCHHEQFIALPHHRYGHVYPSETSFFEEQLRLRQAMQRAEYARKKQLMHRFQDELLALGLGAHCPEISNYPMGSSNHRALRRHPHVRRSPTRPLLVDEAPLSNNLEDLEKVLFTLLHEGSNKSSSLPEAMLPTERSKEQYIPGLGFKAEDKGPVPTVTKAPRSQTLGLDTSSKPPTSSVPPEFQPTFDLGELFSQLLGLLPEIQQSDSTSATRPLSSTSAPLPGSSTASSGINPPAEGTSLKAALESRLNNELESEIRDTIQAIFESLQDPRPSAPAPPTPEASAQVSTDTKGKGKAPVVEASVTPKEPSSLDVARAMDTLTNIEASFRTLMEDFDPKTLSNLVFTSPPSYVVDDENSDSTIDSTSRLAYTSRNGPVRFYIHSLNGILEQLDAIESYGNEELRAFRKEIVGRVEAALEDIEHEVGLRLRVHEKNTPKSKSADEVFAEEETKSHPLLDNALIPAVSVDTQEPPSAVESPDSPIPDLFSLEEQVITPVSRVPSSDPTPSDDPAVPLVDESTTPPVSSHRASLSQPLEPTIGVVSEVSSPVEPPSFPDTEHLATLSESTSHSVHDLIVTEEHLPVIEPKDELSTVDSGEPQPFLSAAFSASEEQKTSSGDHEDVELIEDSHSEWSEVDA